MVQDEPVEEGHVCSLFSLNVFCPHRITACDVAVLVVGIACESFLRPIKSRLQILVFGARHTGCQDACGIISWSGASYKITRFFQYGTLFPMLSLLIQTTKSRKKSHREEGITCVGVLRSLMLCLAEPKASSLREMDAWRSSYRRTLFCRGRDISAI
jgi:hypothetical protein